MDTENNDDDDEEEEKNDKQIVIYEINLTNLILKKNLMKSNFPATRGEN